MIYNEHKKESFPHLDFLSYLFDSEYCVAKDDTPLSAEAKDPQNVLTKADMRALTEQVAHFLRHQYGIGRDGPDTDVVVAVSTGQRALGAALYGVIASGGIYSAAPAAATVPELTRQVRDGPARIVICSADRREQAVGAARAAGLPESHVLVLESHPEVKLYSADGALRCGFQRRLPWTRITDPEALRRSKACILYSSGTTGLPKGVLISHMNLVSVTHIPLVSVRRERERMGIPQPPHGRTLAHLPVAHIAGIMGYFSRPVLDGRLVYWMPSFNFGDFLRYSGELGITSLFTVPPVYMMVAKHPAVTEQFRSVVTATSGAAPMGLDLQLAADRKLGGRLDQIWGMSETTGGVTQVPLDRTDAMGSLGPLIAEVMMRLVDEDGKDVEPGQPGEAWVKGPMITQGYHNNPEANKTAFTPDGWLRTGDILKMDGDLLHMVDRKKELIKYKGTQVAPAELENLLAAHPAVVDAAVIGVQLEHTEVPRAYVVLASSARGKVSEADIADYVAARVSRHKRLRGGVRFIDAVPRSPAGKILRKDLRALQSDAKARL